MRLLIVLLTITLTVSSEDSKSGLTKDEQEKLVAVLNEDRRKVFEKLNMTYSQVEYSKTLEVFIDSVENCKDWAKDRNHSRIVPLKLNDLAHQLYDEFRKGTEFDSRLPFFDPTVTQIGCSKTYQCYYKYEEDKLAGRVLESRGGCSFGRKEIPMAHVPDILFIAPPISKYGDLIGVQEPPGSMNELLKEEDEVISNSLSKLVFLNRMQSDDTWHEEEWKGVREKEETPTYTTI
uniref:Uncharacterized protein n=1 Tax=Caenorhabditis tropicalis TaxID=1561998 RepID=A0A1I7UP21_9PELO